ncbi:hypothetical protein AKJ65_06685 [candidate division MSBL1 archaeon SCGC-AAA259E19]|uniref:Phosphoribosylformylglycinamidine synthase subunit PurQ n=1 Tax=candidate division MSBL1 archaeon SCGC-AAA259E19 TaxID=1698264 RepID=A0A133UFY2_9EURY|nr:hypothetical protein AKJ65_06685 [candidate division MSBL1 archaeon SCGC-AAA259E19]
MKICILRVGGTNCDLETKRSLDSFEDVESEVVRINQLDDDKNLLEYEGLVIPGGFSYGDHIRAGAVFANKIISDLGEEIKKFAENGGIILGICNGFQVLIETGLLPGFHGISRRSKAALAINESAKYECRWIHVKPENRGSCIFTRGIEKDNLFMPVAHNEGRFILQKEEEEKLLKRLDENDQIVFRYSDEEGNSAEKKYPENPNGSTYDIAGICDPSGKIFGLMPHPERAFYGLQLPDWTSRKEVPKHADGKLIFDSMVDYLKRNFR